MTNLFLKRFRIFRDVSLSLRLNLQKNPSNENRVYECDVCDYYELKHSEKEGDYNRWLAKCAGCLKPLRDSLKKGG